MIRLTGNKIAITPVFDPDTTAGKPKYTKEEIKLFEELGGFKTDTVQLVIPDDAKDRCDQGIVKYIGPDVKDVRIGSYVLFGGYDGTTVRLEGEGTLILMRESVIKCIIDNVGGKIDGLYFKEKPRSILYNAIVEAIGQYLPTQFLPLLNSTGLANKILELVNNHSPYFPATHESIIELIANQQEPLKYKNRYNERESPDSEYDE